MPLTPEMSVRRPFPGKALKHLDPFVFLDHFGPVIFRPGDRHFSEGTGPHPHRGFITFSYLLDGVMEHADSRGNHGIVGAGGAQWMKAASGILHDEKPSADFLARGGTLHGFQLWINLPASHKGDTPEYRELPANEVPEVLLPGGAVLRVLIGVYGDAQSPIPTLSPMFNFHLRLPAGQETLVMVPAHWNLFAYLPQDEARFGPESTPASGGELVIFDTGSDRLRVCNPGEDILDVMLYGGQPIGEPVLASGPFVMDTLPGVQAAYDDFYAGKYGTL